MWSLRFAEQNEAATSRKGQGASYERGHRLPRVRVNRAKIGILIDFSKALRYAYDASREE